ncbi:MAG: hypothetical protein RBT80_18345 [Candidatus Vecturithrix sp.]|jgi:hypothetical protein|nr:hypothetical protein [Candidatus Vecturithrix sp.]
MRLLSRAQRRAVLLQKAGFNTIPVAAGHDLTADAEQEARAQQVAIISNGGTMLWDEVLSSRMSW